MWITKLLVEGGDLPLDSIRTPVDEQPLVALERHHAVCAAVQNHVQLAALLRKIRLRDPVKGLVVGFDQPAEVIHLRVSVLVRRAERRDDTGPSTLGLLPGTRQAAAVDHAPQRTRIEDREENQLPAQPEEKRKRIQADERSEGCSTQNDRLVLIDHQFLQNRPRFAPVVVGRRHRPVQ
jgi:hypothetical protein